MASPLPRVRGNRDFYDSLDQARANVSGYNSEATRAKIVKAFETAVQGKSPYVWQTDITEALLLKLDCLVIAGTGSGKTMPFAMPLLLDDMKDKRILVISPLNALEKDQADRFKAMGLTATPVNAEVYNDKLHKEIVEGKHRVLLTSPEMCFDSKTEFSKLIRNPDFTKHFAMIVIDEAHCISTWGPGFRKKYAELGKLRDFVPRTVPFLITSATLPPLILADIQIKLRVKLKKLLLINLGNDRHNITPLVARMKTASDLEALNFVVDEVLSGQSESLVRTMLFVNTRDEAQSVCAHLRKLLPENYHNHIDFYHSMRSRRAKDRVMKHFCDGKIKILCTTEAAAMGMDVGDVDRIVQYMVPGSLCIWFQRYGRAGRTGQPAVVILLVEPTIYQKRKKRKQKKSGKSAAADSADEDDNDEEEADPAEADGNIENDEDQPGRDDLFGDDDQDVGDPDIPDIDKSQDASNPVELEYMKKVEEGMRLWIETLDCRRDVADEYFDNPPRQQVPTVPCCDNCIKKKILSRTELTEDESRMYRLLEVISRSEEPLAVPPPIVDRDDGQAEVANSPINTPRTPQQVKEKRKRNPPGRPGQRRGDRLKECRAALQAWRRNVWRTMCAEVGSNLEPEILLPDSVLTKLASRTHLCSSENLQEEVSDWMWIDELGEDVLTFLEDVDKQWHEKNEEEKAAKKVKRAEETAERNEAKRLERQIKAQAKREEGKRARDQAHAFREVQRQQQLAAGHQPPPFQPYYYPSSSYSSSPPRYGPPSPIASTSSQVPHPIPSSPSYCYPPPSYGPPLASSSQAPLPQVTSPYSFTSSRPFMPWPPRQNQTGSSKSPDSHLDRLPP